VQITTLVGPLTETERDRLIGATSSLLSEVEGSSGHPPLSDLLLADLRAGGSPGFVAAVGRDATGTVVAYAQISTANDTSSLQVALDPGLPDRIDATDQILGATLASDQATTRVNWWVDNPDQHIEQLARRHGMARHRTLHQMRRALPTGCESTIATRPFVPGRDDDAWVATNNRAFAGHEEQGGWTRLDLAARMSEEWFDPDGFLLYEVEGRLAGFCWTKLHPPTETERHALGEIYVIGVDPDLAGRGLGRQLTLAGLDHLARRGAPVGMLHVDAANEAAMRLYRRLDFQVHSTSVAFAATIAK
jgi:mycothiol synthase